MHRLSRQFICPSHISRALRPCSSGSSLPTVLGRKYASSSSPKWGKKFDQLLASLRPGMREDEFAKKIAAMILSTRNQCKLEEIESSIPHIEEFNRTSLYQKVNHYVANPLKHNFKSLLINVGLPTGLDDSPTGVTDSSPLFAGVPEENIPASSSVDHFIDKLTDYLQTPEALRVLERMGPIEQEKLRILLLRISNEPVNQTSDLLDKTVEFLSSHGLRFTYIRPETTKAVQAEGKENPATSVEGDFEELDSVGMAKRAAADASLAPTTPPIEMQNDPYPDLMTSDPLMDSRDVQEFPPDKETPYHNRVIVRNHRSIFNEALEEDGSKIDMDEYKPTRTDDTEESASSRENLPLNASELGKLYRFPLIRRRITQQTGKGKIHRQFVLMVVGNGDGMVGYGQGKDEDATRAEAKAFAQAVRNMDWVERFEKRTIWTEMESKLGATQLIMRPRPVGFGLRCNPNVHQVLKAAGIKDISAKVWGSRNPINVIKAAFRMLQAGHAPLAMGDGIGGPGRKLNKGSGLRSKGDVERERGRQLIGLRK